MDISKLKQLIGDNLKNGVLDLDTAKLESPGITVIATDYLPGGVLKLSDAQITASDSSSITVGGTGTAIPFTGMKVAAKFYLVQTNAALTMTATGTKEWTLNKAVPAFDDTLGAQVRFAATPAPPVLSLLSDPDEGKPQGLTFAGTIDFAAMSAGISTMLGIKTEVLQGPLQLKKGGTEFTSIDFAGPEIKNVNLWLARDCTVAFGMSSEVIADPAIKTQAAIPNIGLTTTIPFSASGNTYELPLSVQVTDLDSFIRLSADITSLIDASLDALSSFAGGANLKKTLPSTFHIEEYVKFTSLFVDFDIKGTSVEMIGIQVNSVKPWPILTVSSTGKTFNAENIQLDFTILKPFAGAEAKPSLNLGGEITLTERASLYVSAGYPNFEIQGYLTEKSVLSIREFVENFVGSASGIPELLYVESLGFDLQSGDYSFEINVDGYWPVNGEENLSLIVQELGFAVHYTKEEKTANFHGSIRVSSIDIDVTADYSSSNEKSGWIFTGKTGLGQRIPIGEFIAYLTDTFNAGKPPSWIEGITLQDLSVIVNTLDKKYEFSVTGNIPIAANDELHITVGFKMEALSEGGYKKILSGKLAIGKSEFNLVYTGTPSDSSILAEWHAVDESGYLQFEDIAKAFGFENPPKVPDGLNLALKEAKLYYDFTKDKQSLIIAAASANYGNAVFAAKKIEGTWTYVIGLDMKIGVDLSNLPLVGSGLAATVGKVGLDSFKLLIATKVIKEPDVKEFNKLITENAGVDYPTLPDLPEGVEKGVYCALVLNLGTDNKFEMQISTAKKEAPKNGLLLAEAPSGKDDNAYWLELQKTLGPVYLDKAGVAYRDGRVSLLLDASLIFTALKIDLIELGVSNPLSKFDPAFELTGLTVAYQSGPVSIAGGFLRQKADEITEYTGMALIGIKTFSLSAMGSYASVDGHPSLFIFALLNAPLGGPPVFFVTGVAAGFGYNRGLKLPSIDTVTKFPLVMGFVPNQESPFKGPDPGEALKILVKEKVVPVQIGQNWVAAGVQFTSFQLLESFALLSVAFGTSLEIGVVGMSTVSVPPKSKIAVAFAQLAILIRLLPDQGIFSVEAKLTPASYILSKSCVLTGGFAFYLWTAPNQHQGDFVVTLGGYHPNFNPPAHYPKVPRLGFNWTVTQEMTIKGGMYFALTPTCIMAGGALEATYKSGNFKAWFIMGADFLISWKPYHYEIHLYLSFGVSYTFKLNLLFTTITTTISVSLGADLAIWGPDFSGTASIHLWIITIKISFGAASDKKAPPISWQEFRESFLPPSAKTAAHEALHGNALGAPIPTDTYCVGRVSRGLVEDLTADKEATHPISWIVNRSTTILETNTVIPAKEYSVVIKDKNGNLVAEDNLIYTNKGDLDARNKDFGVGMVEVDNAHFNSTHTVTVVFEGVLNPKVKYEVFAIISNVPKSLWQNQEAAYDKDALVKQVLTGFRITPLAPVPDQSVPIALENFQYHYEDYFMPIKPADPVLVAGPDNVDGMKRMKDTIDKDPAKKMRSDIIESLIRRGINVNPVVNVKEIAEKAQDFIMAPPVLQYTYWKKPL